MLKYFSDKKHFKKLYTDVYTNSNIITNTLQIYFKIGPSLLVQLIYAHFLVNHSLVSKTTTLNKNLLQNIQHITHINLCNHNLHMVSVLSCF